eukprot:scaffold4976_cov73-Phaeocystis_antarctica.AAC.3
MKLALHLVGILEHGLGLDHVAMDEEQHVLSRARQHRGKHRLRHRLARVLPAFLLQIHEEHGAVLPCLLALTSELIRAHAVAVLIPLWVVVWLGIGIGLGLGSGGSTGLSPGEG